MPLWRRWPHSLRCTQSRRHRRAALTRYANCHRFAARVCHIQLADLQWQWVNLSLSLSVSLSCSVVLTIMQPVVLQITDGSRRLTIKLDGVVLNDRLALRLPRET